MDDYALLLNLLRWVLGPALVAIVGLVATQLVTRPRWKRAAESVLDAIKVREHLATRSPAGLSDDTLIARLDRAVEALTNEFLEQIDPGSRFPRSARIGFAVNLLMLVLGLVTAVASYVAFIVSFGSARDAAPWLPFGLILTGLISIGILILAVDRLDHAHRRRVRRVLVAREGLERITKLVRDIAAGAAITPDFRAQLVALLRTCQANVPLLNPDERKRASEDLRAARALLDGVPTMNAVDL